MTALLEKAFGEAGKLDPQAQDMLASVIIDEMLAEREWDEAFANTQDQLERLSKEALAETRKGKAKPLSFC